MLDSFCEQDSRQLMTTTFSLELRLSLVEIPVVNVEIPDVQIKRFCNNRARRNSSVRAVRCLVLFMALEQYTSMYSVDFLNCGVVYVREEDIEKKVEMLPS